MAVHFGMPLPSHLLLSTQLPAVRSFTASGTYHPVPSLITVLDNQRLMHGSGRLHGRHSWGRCWDCGHGRARSGLRGSRLLATAQTIQGRAAVHVTYLSHLPVCSCYEPNPELLVLVAALSAGSVTIGDAVNHTDVSLIQTLSVHLLLISIPSFNSSCSTTQNGTLLQPDAPLGPADSSMLASAVQRELIHVSVASAAILCNGVLLDWHYVIAANLTAPYVLPATDIGVARGQVV